MAGKKVAFDAVHVCWAFYFFELDEAAGSDRRALWQLVVGICFTHFETYFGVVLVLAGQVQRDLAGLSRALSVLWRISRAAFKTSDRHFIIFVVCALNADNESFAFLESRQRSLCLLSFSLFDGLRLFLNFQ